MWKLTPPKRIEVGTYTDAVTGKALNVPKSDLQITQGLKSRDKVLSLGGSFLKDDKETCISRIQALLDEASNDT